MIELDLSQIKPLIQQALKEDVGSGDITTQGTISEGILAKGSIISRESGIIAGLEVAKLIFELVDSRIKFQPGVKDGAFISKTREIALVEGPARGILTAERLALNFLQKLSGVATLTSKYVEKVKKYGVKIMDTRKTTPTLRALEKYAVRLGGGVNHRMGLYDAVLIKDNHLALTGGVAPAVQALRQKVKPGMKIEVEADTLEDVKEALASNVDAILLDNMDIGVLKRAVEMVRQWNKQHNTKIETEASGKMTLDNVVKVAQTGVDAISIGALTHSAAALDISLEIV